MRSQIAWPKRAIILILDSVRINVIRFGVKYWSVKLTTQTNDCEIKPARAYGGKSADERKQARKSTLVEAAIRLFGEHGFNAVSIDLICTEAGLTKRYFYEAFPSREALLTAAYETVTREYFQAIIVKMAPHLNDAPKLVRAGLKESFGYVRRNPVKARLMMIEAMTVRGQLGDMYGARYDDFVDLLLQVTRPLLGKKPPPDKVFRVMAKATVGALIHLCQNWIATDFAQPIDELVDGMEHLFSGIGKELGVKGY